VTPRDLPAWLTGVQAVTWLATGDVEWTMKAADQLGYASPLPRTREETSALEKDPAKNPLNRAEAAGDPTTWDSWWTWLRVRSGSDLRNEKAQLLRAARSGAVATRRPDGVTPIDPGQWARCDLKERSPNLLLMVVPENGGEMAPLFARDDVTTLAEHESGVGGALQTGSLESRKHRLYRQILKVIDATAGAATMTRLRQADLCAKELKRPVSDRTVRRALQSRSALGLIKADPD